MEALPQLFMRHPDLNNLPPLALPHGWALHKHMDGMEESWESLIERAFGNHFSFESFIVNGGGYRNTSTGGNGSIVCGQKRK